MMILLKERTNIRKRIEELAAELIEEGAKSARICCSVFLKKQGRTIHIRNGLLEITEGEVHLSVNEGPYKGTYSGRTFVSSARPIS